MLYVFFLSGDVFPDRKWKVSATHESAQVCIAVSIVFCQSSIAKWYQAIFSDISFLT